MSQKSKDVPGLTWRGLQDKQEIPAWLQLRDEQTVKTREKAIGVLAMEDLSKR